jgi:hypothetical protein
MPQVRAGFQRLPYLHNAVTVFYRHVEGWLLVR